MRFLLLRKNRGLTIAAAVLFAALLTMAGCTSSSTPDAGAGSPQATASPGGGSSGGGSSAEGQTPAPQKTPDNFNPSGFPIVNEPITLSLLGPKAAIHGPWEQMDLFTELEKMTNIKWTFDTPPSESYAVRKNLAFASGDVPDVFFAGPLTPNDEIVYGQQQGVLIPLEDLIEQYAPNLRDIFQEYPEVKNAVTLPDGHIYSLPRINNVTRDLAPVKLWINKDWLAGVGLPLPTSTDDLFAALKAFKENDLNGNGKADEIPLSSIKISDIRLAFLAAFGEVASNANYVSVVDDNLRFYPTQPGYKEMLAFLNKLYAEGLLDTETFAQSSQQMTAKGNDGVLGLFNNGGGAFTVVGADKNAQYTLLPPLTSPVNDQPKYPKSHNVTRGLFSITNANPHPEATIRWIDHFYSDEGSVLAVFGKENEGWRWLDASKTQWERIAPDGMGLEEYRGGRVTPDAGVAIATIRKADFLAKRANTGDIGLVDKEVDDKIIQHWSISYPLVYFDEAQQNRINALEADMKPYIEEMEAKFITGAESLDRWDGYVDTLQRMGAKEYMQIHQQAFDTYMSR